MIHGADDRVEAFAVADDELRELAQTAAVAIAMSGAVHERAGAVELGASSLGESENLCSGEPFAEQPAGAACSGLLVDRDLVLTAGHCALMIGCDAMRLVVGWYYEAEGALAPLDGGDVYGCAEVVASERSPRTAAERLDYAWIRLDRAVDAWVPRAIDVRDASRPLDPHEPLAMFGFPSGTPLKIDAGAAVADPRPSTLDYFTATTDSFYGNSGSPIFDATGVLVGIQNRGALDFFPAGAGCNKVWRAPAEAVSEEQATYAFRALDGLCEQDPRRSACGPSQHAYTSTDCAVTHAGAGRGGPLTALCMMGLFGALSVTLSRRRGGASAATTASRPMCPQGPFRRCGRAGAWRHRPPRCGRMRRRVVGRTSAGCSRAVPDPGG